MLLDFFEANSHQLVECAVFGFEGITHPAELNWVQPPFGVLSGHFPKAITLGRCDSQIFPNRGELGVDPQSLRFGILQLMLQRITSFAHSGTLGCG